MRVERARSSEAQVSDEHEGGKRDQTPEERVAALVHEIAKTINAGEVEDREGLREVAVGLLRDEVQTAAPALAAAPAPTGGTFNPFGIGIPLILMGGVLVFLFPPVGLLMFAAAALMIAWGVGATVLGRR